MRKNQGMEVSVIGIPLREAIRAIRDAAWKQICRGKGRSGEGAGKVKENGNASFFRSSSSHVHVPFAHWVNTVLSVVRSFLNLPSPPFLSFFLSFRSLFMRATIGGFDSIPFPAILEIHFFSFGHRFTAHFQPAYLCVQSSLFTVILPFLGRIVQFFGFHSFFFFFLKTSEHASFFVAFDEIFPCI